MPEMTDAEREAMEAAASASWPPSDHRLFKAGWHAAREFSRREPPSPEEVERAAGVICDREGEVPWDRLSEAMREFSRQVAREALTAARGGDDG